MGCDSRVTLDLMLSYTWSDAELPLIWCRVTLDLMLSLSERCDSRVTLDLMLSLYGEVWQPSYPWSDAQLVWEVWQSSYPWSDAQLVWEMWQPSYPWYDAQLVMRGVTAELPLIWCPACHERCHSRVTPDLMPSLSCAAELPLIWCSENWSSSASRQMLPSQHSSCWAVDEIAETSDMGILLAFINSGRKSRGAKSGDLYLPISCWRSAAILHHSSKPAQWKRMKRRNCTTVINLRSGREWIADTAPL